MAQVPGHHLSHLTGLVVSWNGCGQELLDSGGGAKQCMRTESGRGGAWVEKEGRFAVVLVKEVE